MRGALLFSLTFALASGCGGISLVSPASGDAAWRELRSPHFILRTDLGEADAAERLTEFERIYGAFEDVAYPHEPKPRGTIQIILFASEGEYERFSPQGAAAFFTTSPNDPERPPTLVLPQGLSDGVRALFQHELSHRFVAFYFPAAPTWLNEGMAEFYSSLRLDAERVYIGEPLLDRFLITGDRWSTVRVDDRSNVLAVPTGALPSLDVLRSFDQATFYAEDGGGPRSREAKLRVTANYTAAWGLVHLLQVGRQDLHARFLRYLRALTEATRDPAAAWNDAYGDLPPGELQRAFNAFVGTQEVEIVSRPYAPRPPVEQAARAMSAAEVHVLRARLHDWSDAGSRRAAEPHLALAVAAAPDHPEPRLARGLIRLASGDVDGCRADLSRAVDLAPSDPRYLFPLAAVLTRAELDLPEGARVWDEIEPLVKLLEHRASTTMQLNFLAAYSTVRGRFARALRYAERAISSQASCEACYDTLAELFAAEGQLPSAVQAARIALNLTPERDRTGKQERLRRLAAYQRAMVEAEIGRREPGQPAPSAPDKR